MQGVSTTPGFLKHVHSATAILLLLATIIVGARLVVSWMSWSQLNRVHDDADRAVAVIDRATVLLAAIGEAESGQRGYLLTHRDSYLAPYNTAVAQIPSLRRELLTLTRGTANQPEVEHLSATLEAKISEMGQSIALSKDKGFNAATSLVLTDRGEAAMNEISRSCSRIIEANQQRLRQANQSARAKSRILEVTSLGGGVLLFALLAVASLVIQREYWHRQAADRNLREERELLAQFVQHVPAAVAMFDRNMRYLRVSERWCADYHLDAGTVIGKSHYDVFQDLPQRWCSLHFRGLAGEMLRVEDDRFDRSDGSHIWLSWEIRPWGRRGGAPEGILIFSEDVTQRKILEEELRASESRYRDLFENSNEGIASCEVLFTGGMPSDIRFLEVNRQFIALTGLCNPAGVTLSELCPGIQESDPKFLEQCGAVAAEAKPKKFEIFITALGEWYSVSAYSQRKGFLVAAFDLISERKRIEQALADKHKQLETIVATAPGAVCAFRLDQDGQTSMPYASPALHRMLPQFPDLTSDAEPMLSRLHAEDQDRVRRAMLESAQTGNLFSQDCRLAVPARGTVWLEIRSLPEKQEDGSVIWYGTILDVTENRQAKDSLMQSQLDYRSLLDNSPDAIARFDRESRFIFVNKSFVEGFQVDENVIIGMTPMEAGGRAANLIGLVGDVFETGIPVTADYRSDGETPTLWHVRVVPEPDASGIVRTLLLIGSDVTESRRQFEIAQVREREIHERDSQLAAIFNASAQAIFGVDADGVIRVANRIADALFGYMPGELVGCRLEVLLTDDLRERHRNLRGGVMDNPTPQPMGLGKELTGRRKDGTAFPVEIGLGYTDTLHGPMAICCVSDISVRKQQEQALHERDAELHRMNTALLTAQEDIARQIARELHDDIAQRLSWLSFRVSRIAEAPGGEKIADQLRSVQENIAAISDAIEKVSHEMHPSILDELGLSTGLESLCIDAKPLLQTDVEFYSSGVPDDLPTATALCIYRIAQESIRNIYKHSHANHVKVTVIVNSGWLELKVEDDGVGLNRAAPGGGMGMLSMRERMRLVGGTFSARSDGGGTTVIARAPLNSGGVGGGGPRPVTSALLSPVE